VAHFVPGCEAVQLSTSAARHPLGSLAGFRKLIAVETEK
jgi:hypothetical protein